MHLGMQMLLGPTLQERIRRLEDRVAIGELVARYCLVMDNRDVDAIENLFTADVRVWSADGVMDARGRQAVLELFKGRFAVLGPSNHFTHDRIVEFDPRDHDLATGIAAPTPRCSARASRCWRPCAIKTVLPL